MEADAVCEGGITLALRAGAGLAGRKESVLAAAGAIAGERDCGGGGTVGDTVEWTCALVAGCDPDGLVIPPSRQKETVAEMSARVSSSSPDEEANLPARSCS